MNRLKTRLPIAVVAALTAALISGCGAGQISQTANQEPAVNGNRATIANKVALRDIRIRALQSGDNIGADKTVELVLVAVNLSPDTDDRLVGVTSDIGKVSIPDGARLPAGGTLLVGTPDGGNTQPGPLDPNRTVLIKAPLTLKQPISNGLTYDFTFNFEQAGPTSVAVPIAAPSSERGKSDQA